jgi:hypothetical protein
MASRYVLRLAMGRIPVPLAVPEVSMAMPDISVAVAQLEVRTAMADVRGAVAGETQYDRDQCKQRAKGEAREKDRFHGTVWSVVYSSSVRVSIERTYAARN